MTVESLLKVIEEGMTVILKTEKNRIIVQFECGNDIEAFSCGFLYRKIKNGRELIAVLEDTKDVYKRQLLNIAINTPINQKIKFMKYLRAIFEQADGIIRAINLLGMVKIVSNIAGTPLIGFSILIAF